MKKILTFFLFLISIYLHSQNILYPTLDSTTLNKIKQATLDGIPLYFLDAHVSFDAIGTPEVNLIVKNISIFDVDAYNIKVRCYNNYDQPVNHYLKGTNIYSGISQEILKAGKTTYLDDEWTLYGYDNTTKVKITLTKVHFTNGKVWAPSKKQMTINGKTLY